jgi:hypothetical protein
VSLKGLSISLIDPVHETFDGSPWEIVSLLQSQ